MAQVTLPDGSVRQVASGSTVADLASQIGPGLARAAIVARVDDRMVDLSYPLLNDHSVQILTRSDPAALEVLRHSTAHVLAQAARHIFGAELQYTIGPVIANGFYYDLQFPTEVALAPDDLPKLEAEMQKIIDADLPFARRGALRGGPRPHAWGESTVQGRDHHRARR